MSKTIAQRVTLAATPARLFAMYLSAKHHAAITGAPVRIGSRPGTAFSTFGGQLSGKTLHTPLRES